MDKDISTADHMRHSLAALFLLPNLAWASPATIAFSLGPVGGPANVNLLSADANLVTQLPNAFCGPTSTICWPEFSPDGTIMVFQAAIPGLGTGIYTVRMDGTNLTRLSLSTGNPGDASPSFDPSGTKIVYNHLTAGNKPTIATMNADGSGAADLITASTTVYYLEPHWSVNNQIVYMSNSACGDSTCQDIWVMNSDGTSKTRLTTNGNNGDPEWDPTGNTIAFSRSPDGINENVYTISKTGTNLTQITTFVAPQEAGVPSYNYNGTKIVFEWDIGGQLESILTVPTAIGLINTDGSGLNVLSQYCANAGCHPKWSWR